MATWVFAYGSLIWKQDFPVLQSRRAMVTGWSRRLWQGSHDHRGTPEAPGRVLTLVPLAGATCEGLALLVDDDVFDHLDYREKNGYERVALPLETGTERLDAVTYLAAEGNFAWLGDAPLDAIVEQVARSHGPSGSNRDYVLELDAALSRLAISDTHIGMLAARLRAIGTGIS